MAQIKITAKLKSFRKSGLRTYSQFRSADGSRYLAEPFVKDGIVEWLVPDIDFNRELFQKSFEPSGVFEAETVNQRTPEPFLTAKTKKKEAAGDETEPKAVDETEPKAEGGKDGKAG